LPALFTLTTMCTAAIAVFIADEVIRTVVSSARTGKIGDGKVFVFEVAEVIRIRNDDRGEGAL
jgi:nitrogen regulatory protein PII